MMAHMNVSSHVWLLTGNNIKVINELIHIKNEDESILLLLCERQIQFSELGFYLFFICLIFRYIFTIHEYNHDNNYKTSNRTLTV